MNAKLRIMSIIEQALCTLRDSELLKQSDVKEIHKNILERIKNNSGVEESG
jgi:hypothetical protein